MARPPTVQLVLESADPGRQALAMELSDRLDLPIGEARFGMSGADLVLAVRDEHLELRDANSRPGRGLFVDFTAIDETQARRRGMLSKNQPLGRALGKATRTVLDATAGLGQDAALLARMGYDVTAVERSPILAALLEDGLRHALRTQPQARDSYLGRLKIIEADARQLLRSQAAAFDAVYIDPMFPPKRKTSALAKKSIRLVRELVGEDEDADDLLQTALKFASRVVVKRPTYAPPFAPQPTMSIEGKLVRYDVYVKH